MFVIYGIQFRKIFKNSAKKKSDFSRDARMEDWNMIPRPHPDVHIGSDTNSLLRYNNASAKRNSLIQKIKRNRHKALGLMKSVTKLILKSPSTANKNKKCRFCQKNFMEWRAEKYILDIQFLQ
ncbi:hypothetical protein AYI69_g11578 [Smittium culicis]|uniref:Uncharacterized protein n=1 Tax=Smittium culicis TaxID=133412 RepID=A0A1R1WXG2_9FUNG|nr:hypothetical protein AYI69_g11578 [Smittium culicis]